MMEVCSCFFCCCFSFPFLFFFFFVFFPFCFVVGVRHSLFSLGCDYSSTRRTPTAGTHPCLHRCARKPPSSDAQQHLRPHACHARSEGVLQLLLGQHVRRELRGHRRTDAGAHRNRGGHARLQVAEHIVLAPRPHGGQHHRRQRRADGGQVVHVARVHQRRHQHRAASHAEHACQEARRPARRRHRRGLLHPHVDGRRGGCRCRRRLLRQHAGLGHDGVLEGDEGCDGELHAAHGDLQLRGWETRGQRGSQRRCEGAPQCEHQRCRVVHVIAHSVGDSTRGACRRHDGERRAVRLVLRQLQHVCHHRHGHEPSPQPDQRPGKPSAGPDAGCSRRRHWWRWRVVVAVQERE
eukprot:Rhum_TRINITY_DN14783_c8_g1::Rhum_TRINITY_DN14783_c8_g1_i2::g.118695::m.118695